MEVDDQVMYLHIVYNVDEIDGDVLWCTDETGFEVELYEREVEILR